MFVRPLEFGSAEYQAACELRRRFLREPLGLELTAQDVAGEDSQHHFGLFDESGVMMGSAIGKTDPDDEACARIRQVVVHPDYRGRREGFRLMQEVERLLALQGYQRFVLFARDEAAAFYDRCGYIRTGATKQLIGMLHHEMRKDALSC